MSGTLKAAAVAALIGLAIAGCDQKNDEASAPVTLDTRLGEIYGHTCQTCHENAESGAPVAHDLAQWKPRLAQGDKALRDHMVEGFNGMPPLGQCIECSEEDLMTLMRFMSSPAPKSEASKEDKKN